jgi:GntR family transcriptional regulator
VITVLCRTRYSERGHGLNIIIRNASDLSIYEQIQQQLKAAILSGELAAGELLPSIRQLAKELRISVITTKRAYDELEREGFIEQVQGKGSYVKAQNASLIREEHLRQIEELLHRACTLARQAAIDQQELHEILTIMGGEQDCD